MNITKKEMDEINKIQLDIFKEFINVCDKLGLKYFLVHGSLLGAVRYNGFFPYDDDIDVAMPRKDYDLFIKNGQQYLSKHLFIQSNDTEKDYPLVFAKVRNNNTAFIQPVLDKLDINKGIYIDVFPIDNYPINKVQLYRINILKNIYKIRVSSMFKTKNNLIKKFFMVLSFIIVPNKYKALEKMNNLYSNISDTGKIILYGGKTSDAGIDSELFKNNEYISFEGINSSIPTKYKEYLNIIYGDYKTYSPSEKYMKNDDLVEVSADIIDTKKSYLEYKNNK